MRRIASVLVGSLAVTALVVAPASAEKPIPEVITEVFTDIDPCTEQPHEVTINMVNRVQEGKNDGNLIVQVNRVSGFTDDGYVLVNGAGRVLQSDQWFLFQFTDTWANGETREKFQVSRQLMVDRQTGDVKRDVFKARCLGKPAVE